MKAEFTTRTFAAVAITQHALADGYDRIIAVGGDGTVSEVANGFHRERAPTNRDAVLGFIMAGTGSDLRRTFDIASGIESQIARLAAAQPREIDLGRVTYVNEQGQPEDRLFINISSFGLSGSIARRVNQATQSKKLGGRFSFMWNSAVGTICHRNRPVHLQIDKAFDEVMEVTTVAVANGQFFGGGMWIAPGADPADGLFDVVIMRDVGRFETMRDLPKVYAGRHLENPKVRVVRGRKVTALPIKKDGGKPVRIEVDGESPGQLPATFEILPRAIRVAA